MISSVYIGTKLSVFLLYIPGAVIGGSYGNRAGKVRDIKPSLLFQMSDFTILILYAFTSALVIIITIFAIAINELPENAFTKVIKFTLWSDLLTGCFDMLYWISRAAMHQISFFNDFIDMFIGCSLYGGLVLTWYCYYIINQGGYRYTINPNTTIGCIIFFQGFFILLSIYTRGTNLQIWLGLFNQIIMSIIIPTRIYFNALTFIELKNLKRIRQNLLRDPDFIDINRPKHKADELISEFLLVFTTSDFLTLVPLYTFWVLSNVFGIRVSIIFEMANLFQPLKAFMHLYVIYNHRVVIMRKRSQDRASLHIITNSDVENINLDSDVMDVTSMDISGLGTNFEDAYGSFLEQSTESIDSTF
jgi:hypothetical protein